MATQPSPFLLLALPLTLTLFTTACVEWSAIEGPMTDANWDSLEASPETDSDGDGILDQHEGSEDLDEDGSPNYLDSDSDGDQIPDSVEAGDADFLDLDSDDNGLPDAVEGASDDDNDGIPNHADPDNDGDGIDDSVELGPDPTSPVDTDGDGVADYEDTDADNDGLLDAVEGADDPDEDGIPSYLDQDSDNDGLSDSQESGPDPEFPLDSDGDGFFDFEDTDSDNDGIRDPDELEFGTSITNRDSDGDGFSDLAELTVGSDPLDATSGVSGFYAEVAARSPVSIDVPFTPSILQADVLFVLDSTCSMMGVLDTMAANFSQVVSGITIPDVAFGVAEFEDFAYISTSDWMGMVDAGDKPFVLRQQITSNPSAVQTTLNSLWTHDGADAPESSMEALYQAASGRGYDQDCDNTFDSTTDVPPFQPDAGSDAFGGNVPGVSNPSIAGTGSIGGAGFREGSVPILVYTTDNWMRDPDAGYSVPNLCSDAAGRSDVAEAVTDIGGRLIAVGTNPTPIPQMVQLAVETGSLADLDGNGSEEPLVFEGTSSATVDFVLEGIEALAGGSRWDLSLAVQDEPYDFVSTIEPAVVEDSPIGQEVTFTLTVDAGVPQTQSDQVFVFPVQVLGNGTSILAEWELVLVVLPN